MEANRAKVAAIQQGLLTYNWPLIIRNVNGDSKVYPHVVIGGNIHPRSPDAWKS